MNWILNSMRVLIAGSFWYHKTTMELWYPIATAYSHKKNNVQVYQQTREIAQLSRVINLWVIIIMPDSKVCGESLTLYRLIWPCAKEQVEE